MITVDKITKQLRKLLANWKVPGLVNVQGFWLKNMKLMHGRVATVFISFTALGAY